MKGKGSGKAHPRVVISMERAARLHRLIGLSEGEGRLRERVLRDLGIGLRTFYRELELLRALGVEINLAGKAYRLAGTAEAAAGRLPFPDPGLSFAEVAELARGAGPAAIRLAGLLEAVTGPIPAPEVAGRRQKRGRK